jgi:hypothetical protein
VQRATDFHQIYVTGTTQTSPLSPPSATRTVYEWFRVLGNRTITLPAAMPAPTITTLTGPYKRLQATYSEPADYQLNTLFAYTESTALRFASVSASLGYLGSTNATLALPNFDGLANWNNAWPPATSSTGFWSTQANGNNFGAGGACVENARLVGAGRLGAY